MSYTFGSNLGRYLLWLVCYFHVYNVSRGFNLLSSVTADTEHFFMVNGTLSVKYSSHQTCVLMWLQVDRVGRLGGYFIHRSIQLVLQVLSVKHALDSTPHINESVQSLSV